LANERGSRPDLAPDSIGAPLEVGAGLGRGARLGRIGRPTEETGVAMAEKACVYSVLVGGYEKLTEQPVAKSSDIDFVLFTDDPATTSETWQIRHEETVLPQDPGRSSRRAKLLPHVALPDYDVSLYVDNRVVLSKPPEIILADLLPEGAVFVLNAHDHRATVRDEFDAVVALGKDAPWICAEQLEHYERCCPEVLGTRPLWSGFMIRRHHDPLLRRTNEIWWTHLLRYSRRDQLSLMTALEETGLQPTILDHAAKHSDYHDWLPFDQVERKVSRAGQAPGMAALAECRAEVNKVRKELRDARDDANQARRRLVQATERLSRQEAHSRRLTESRDELLASTSWKVTAPLRRLADRVRKNG